MRTARYQGLAAFTAASLALSAAMATAQDPSRPTIILPLEGHSVRAAKPVAGSIMAEQPNFPGEMTRAYHNDSNWLYLARITSRTATPITSLRIGWAYALPAGLEFHQTDTITPAGGLSQGGWYETLDLKVAPRADAFYLVTFAEQVTFSNGMVFNADHAKISAFYKNCCTGPNAGNEPQIPQARVQPNMPGGALPRPARPGALSRFARSTIMMSWQTTRNGSNHDVTLPVSTRPSGDFTVSPPW